MPSSTEKYELEIGDEGLDYDLLDISFNPTTQAFLLKAGLKPGMKVLDVGCGSGVMTAWLAKQVGPQGKVIAIDNSDVQLNVARRRLQKENVSNTTLQVLSAYDIHQLNETFDFIYCRFVMHHLHSPRKAIKLFHDQLNPKGIYVGEEGIVSAMFAYPPTFAWEGYEPKLKNPQDEVDGEGRDGDFGMKLMYFSKQAGFNILDAALVQPLLWTREQKKGLLENLHIFKKTALEQGTTEEEWQKKFEETERIVNDDNQMIGF